MENTPESIWDGPLSRIRDGIFSTGEDEEIRYFLNSLPNYEQYIPKEIARCLWFMPMFLEWQVKRVAEHSPENLPLFYQLSSWVTEKVGELLGNP